MEDPEIQRPNCKKKKGKQSKLIDQLINQSINRPSEHKSSSLTLTQRKIKTKKTPTTHYLFYARTKSLVLSALENGFA